MATNPKEEGTKNEFIGCAFGTSSDGTVISISAKGVQDEDRWETMPSLVPFPRLEKLELDKSRYITSLGNDLTSLDQLKQLKLTRCARLKRLPDSIGMLKQLQEVSTANSIPSPR